MSKPAWGTKRVCPSCGARFYDLSRTPITCPVCQAVYQVMPPPSRRGERAQPVEVRKVVEPEVEAPALETPDIIGLEEAEEAGRDRNRGGRGDRRSRRRRGRDSCRRRRQCLPGRGRRGRRLRHCEDAGRRKLSLANRAPAKHIELAATPHGQRDPMPTFGCVFFALGCLLGLTSNY